MNENIEIVFRDVLGPTRRNILALVAVTLLLALGHWLIPHWSTRYGSYLAIFSIWMAWFVLTVVAWLRETEGDICDIE